MGYGREGETGATRMLIIALVQTAIKETWNSIYQATGGGMSPTNNRSRDVLGSIENP
jgi:hypothetical protein